MVSNDSSCPNFGTAMPKILGLIYVNQVSTMIRTKFTLSLHDVVLGLLQYIDPVLDLQIKLRPLKMVLIDYP